MVLFVFVSPRMDGHGTMKIVCFTGLDSPQRKTPASTRSEQAEYESGEDTEVSVPRRAPKKKRKLQVCVQLIYKKCNCIHKN